MSSIVTTSMSPRWLLRPKRARRWGWHAAASDRSPAVARNRLVLGRAEIARAGVVGFNFEALARCHAQQRLVARIEGIFSGLLAVECVACEGFPGGGAIKKRPDAMRPD